MKEQRDYTEIIDKIMKGIEPTIQEAIKIHVNGHIISLSEKLQQYIDKDEEWKKGVDSSLKRLKPVSSSIKFYHLLKSGVKELVSWIIPISIVSGAVTAYYKFIK